MEKLVSLLYNKEKASYAFFGENVNKSVHFFVYGVCLTFAVFMDGDLPYNLLESRRSYFSKLYYCDVPSNIRLPLWSDYAIAGPHRIISIFNKKKTWQVHRWTSQKNVRSLPTK